MDYKPSTLDKMRNFLKIKDLLNNKRVTIVDFYINISLIEFYIRDQICIIDNKKKKK